MSTTSRNGFMTKHASPGGDQDLPRRAPAQQLPTAVRLALALEILMIAGAAVIFWLPDFNRIFAAALLLPALTMRIIVLRRPYDAGTLPTLVTILLALGVINIFAAPYDRGSLTVGGALFSLSLPYDVIVIGRPLMGGLLALTIADRARRFGQFDGLLTISAGLALIVGALGITAAQWSVKSISFRSLLDTLPRIAWFPGAESGFNVNEIGGAMAWLAPLAAGLALYRGDNGRVARLRQWTSAAALILLMTGLFFGQSRFAILGVIPALAVIVHLLMRGQARRIAFALLAVYTLAEIAVVSKLFEPPTTQLIERDENSIHSRLLIWGSGLAMVRDHPLTGVGMNLYRAPDVRAAYPVFGFEQRILPHAHNEFLQAATDLGLPGMVVLIGLYGVAGRMLWRSWRRGGSGRAVTLGIAGGLAAHAVFGVGDAITLWDRFAFLFWWMIGLAAAQTALAPDQVEP